MACGVYKIGGSSGGFTATVDSEMLPGFEDCGSSAADVEWMSLNRTSASLAPGASVTVRVTMDPNVAQPGTYTASVAIGENAPGTAEPVDGDDGGQRSRGVGQVGRDGQWPGLQRQRAPLPGATVQADSWAGSWTFSTESDGTYAYWFNSAANPLSLIAAKDGYSPQARTVRLYPR